MIGLQILFTYFRSGCKNRKHVVVNVHRFTFKSNILGQLSRGFFDGTQSSIYSSSVGNFKWSVWFVRCKGCNDDSFQICTCVVTLGTRGIIAWLVLIQKQEKGKKKRRKRKKGEKEKKKGKDNKPKWIVKLCDVPLIRGHVSLAVSGGMGATVSSQSLTSIRTSVLFCCLTDELHSRNGAGEERTIIHVHPRATKQRKRILFMICWQLLQWLKDDESEEYINVLRCFFLLPQSSLSLSLIGINTV